MTHQSTQVLVIDDHPLFCEALMITLQRGFELCSVVKAFCLEQAMDCLKRTCSPDIVLLDLNLPDVEALDGLKRLRNALPGVPIAIISSFSDDTTITASLKAGASGFIPKDASCDEILRAFTLVLEGKTYVSDEYVKPVRSVKSQPGNGNDENLTDSLTPRQKKILQLICEGLLNKQIAYELDISETTVKAHVSAILQKLKVNNRTQAVLLAQREKFRDLVGEHALL